jgi:predicted lysophospholipase L1 biosynthesis ABC-type transport system permease subunit
MSSVAGAVVGAIIGGLAGIFLIVSFFKSFIIVREKQQVVLERLGAFRATLTPGTWAHSLVYGCGAHCTGSSYTVFLLFDACLL